MYSSFSFQIYQNLVTKGGSQKLDTSLPKMVLLNQYIGMSSLLVSDTCFVQYAARHNKKARKPFTGGANWPLFCDDTAKVSERSERER